MHTTLDLPCVICVTGGRKPGSVDMSKGSTTFYRLVSHGSRPGGSNFATIPSLQRDLLAGWLARLGTV